MPYETSSHCSYESVPKRVIAQWLTHATQGRHVSVAPNKLKPVLKVAPSQYARAHPDVLVRH